MGRLRATSKEERRAKRSRILAAARDLFENWSFQDISMQRIAGTSGSAKGTVYLYFATKEELFLALFDLAVEKWIEGLLAHFNESAEVLPSAEIAGLVASTLTAQPTLIRLFTLRNRCLNGDIRPEAAAAHKNNHRQLISRLAAALDRRTALSPEQATRWLLRTEVILTGLAQSHSPGPPPVGATDLHLDFESELRHMATILLEHAKTPRTS